MLFSVGNHDLPCIFIPHRFQCFYHWSYFESLYSSNIFSCLFTLLHLPLVIPVVTRCYSFFCLITGSNKVAWHLHILFMSDLVVSDSRKTVSFDFFAAHEICSILRGNHISVASSLFVAVLKLSGPHIDTSEWVQWVQYSTPELFLLC